MSKLTNIIKVAEFESKDGYIVGPFAKTGAPEQPQVVEAVQAPAADQVSLISDVGVGSVIEADFTKEQLVDTVKYLHAMVVDLNSRLAKDTVATKTVEQRNRIRYEGLFGTVELKCCTCKVYEDFVVVFTLAASEMKYTPPSNPEMAINLQYLPEGQPPFQPVSVISYGIAFDCPGTPYTAAVFLKTPA